MRVPVTVSPILVLTLSAFASGGVVNLTTGDLGSFDAQYNDAMRNGFAVASGDSLTMNPGTVDVSVGTAGPENAPPPFDQRGVLEFILPGGLSGTTINAATFSLIRDTTSSTLPDIELYIYSGNGTADDADFAQTATMFASFTDLNADISADVTSELQTDAD